MLKEFLSKRSYVRGGPPVPLLRGYFHAAAAIVTLVTLPLVLAILPGSLVRAAVCLALLQKAFLYYVSGLGHTTEFMNIAIHDKVFLLDHANIFLTLAADMTTVFMAKVDPKNYELWPILSVWLTSYAVVINFKVFGKTSNKMLFFALVCLMAVLLFNASLRLSLTSYQFLLSVLIAVSGMTGATCWALESPNPFPEVLGHHEIHHICSLIAQGIHMHLLVDICSC